MANYTGTPDDDIYVGTTGADTISGAGGNDKLYGNGGADTIHGDDGNDEIWTGGRDAITGAGLYDFGTVTANVFGDDGDDVLSIGSRDNADGGAGNDELRLAFGGNVTLNTSVFVAGGTFTVGGATIKNMETFTYIVCAGGLNQITVSTFAYTFTVICAGGNDILTATGSAVVFQAGAGNDNIYAPTVGNNVFDGGDGIDRVTYTAYSAGLTIDLSAVVGGQVIASNGDQLIGIEYLAGSGFADHFTGDAGVNELFGGDGDDYLDGGLGNDMLNGEAGNDTLIGGDGNDILTGGAGADLLIGGTGNDIYYVDTSDTIQETAGNGFDYIYTLVSFVLPAGVEIEYMTANGIASINLTGNEFGQVMEGNGYANVLTGGGGVDRMMGRAGDDIYYADADDIITELANEGNDTLYASGSYVLAAGVSIETLRTSDLTGAVNLTGNALTQRIFGNDANNILTDGAGGADADQLYGMGGDDKLIAAGGADLLDGGDGFDIASYEIAPGGVTLDLAGGNRSDGAAGNDTYVSIEMFQLSLYNDIFYGSAGDDIVDGLGGNDILVGGAGNDIMVGGSGDDLFIVSGADYLIEASDAGFDQAYVDASYTLNAGAAIEVLSVSELTATTALNITGNEFAQFIIGNDGSNVLSGGGGADTLQGRQGNDVYIVDSDDRIIEAAGAGFDQAYASSNYTLGAGVSVEVLSANDLAATTALTLIGNEFSQQIVGNAGANVLASGGGGDTLMGLGGNDVYIIGAGDIIVEGTGQGFDQAYTSGSATLGAGAEIEVFSTSDLAATTAIDLTGNEFGQQIIGNAGKNTLSGGGGNDYLFGMGGADTLIGGDGADSFYFTTLPVFGVAGKILDFTSGTDKIVLSQSAYANLNLGALSADAFVAGTAPQDPNDRLIYDSATGALIYDPDGSGAQGGILITVLENHATLTASDFFVIA